MALALGLLSAIISERLIGARGLTILAALKDVVLAAQSSDLTTTRYDQITQNRNAGHPRRHADRPIGEQFGTATFRWTRRPVLRSSQPEINSVTILLPLVPYFTFTSPKRPYE
jgi:hypothetical protein